MNTNLQELSQEIKQFLTKFAVVNPNYDDGRFTSPDATELTYCAELLSNGKIPKRCFSEWGSGGYRPYSSQIGEHLNKFLT